MLGRLLAALGGLLGLGVLGGCPGGSTYGQKSIPGSLPAGGKNVSRLEWDQKALPDGISAQFFVDGKPVYLLYVSVSGTANYTAVKRRCPHSGCTVNYSYQTRRLECPCHGSTFLADGTLEKGPARRNLTTYPVQIDGGKVIVEVPGSVLATQGVQGIF
jgi:cytochrome b6-f complex iron-sulfur subunit